MRALPSLLPRSPPFSFSHAFIASHAVLRSAHSQQYAPFVEDSDDKLSQLAQLQIFLTLLSSLALRSHPPDAFVGSLVTVVLFLVPLIGLALETPLLDVLGEVTAKITGCVAQLFPNLKPPPFQLTAPAKEEEVAVSTRHEVAMVLPDPSPLNTKAPANAAPAPVSPAAQAPVGSLQA